MFEHQESARYKVALKLLVEPEKYTLLYEYTYIPVKTLAPHRTK
jgi:hypothetical protein